jgi:hypothetical protein
MLENSESQILNFHQRHYIIKDGCCQPVEVKLVQRSVALRTRFVALLRDMEQEAERGPAWTDGMGAPGGR